MHRARARGKAVQVFVLLTETTIEERLLTTLSGKHELALAALDLDSDVDEVMLAVNLPRVEVIMLRVPSRRRFSR